MRSMEIQSVRNSVLISCFFLMAGCRIAPPAEEKEEPFKTFQILGSDAAAKAVVCRISASCKESNDSIQIHVETTFHSVSNDLGRNVRSSLMGMTTFLFISTSGVAVFHFTIKKKNVQLGSFSLSGRGRAGYYAVLPLWAGLIGTAAGTWIGGLEPKRLREDCARGQEKSCELYSDFLSSSFFELRFKFREEMLRILEKRS